MTSRSTEVAIIGMACLFPKAPNLQAFWENILAGVDALGDPPAEWGGDHAYDPTAADGDKLYTKRGGYLRDLARFDPFAFGVMPRSVEGGEPEHFVALRLAHDALADAGYLDRPFSRERTEVILGRGTYANRGFVTVLQHTFALEQIIRLLGQLQPERTPADLDELRRRLKESLPPFNVETAPSLPHSVMCGRIANRLDLMGSAFTVDAACASTLIAADLGMKDLLGGHCDLVIAGGIQISTTFPIALLFSQLGALSRTGSVRPFHQQADGTLLGEGAGVVVLKRLEEAERDGDRVYAVLKKVGTASDGRAMGILAPRLEGEELALRRAYDASGIPTSSIGLMEAHGTGTPVGDATELAALRRVFGPRQERAPACALGSVKSMIGHCIPAAAAAGLIKTALAVYHKVLPPTLHTEEPNPALASTPFYLNSETRPWIHSGPEPRRAGVSAFGFGGINAHAILEEHRAPARQTNLHRRRDSELFLVSAATRQDLSAKCDALRRFVQANPEVDPWDLAYTLNCPAPKATSHRLSVVASSPEELARKLTFALGHLNDPSRRRIKERGGIYFLEERLGGAGRLAFLFPGEGAQYEGMLADLCLHFPQVRIWFDLMDRAFRDHRRGHLPSQAIFPAPGGAGPRAGEEEQGRLWRMDSAIESVFAADQALHAMLTHLGISPDAVLGHSTGEYSALLASGAAEVEGEGRLIDHILEGNKITESVLSDGLVPQGVLLAVGPADPELLRRIARSAEGSVHVAMDNCPHQVVFCGTEEAVGKVQAEAREMGAVCQRLPFARAYHTPSFAPVVERLRPFYEGARFAAPRVALYSCAIAGRVAPDPEAVRALALEQWMRPVRFRETIEVMHDDGIRVFVEVGPRGNLTSFVEDTLRGRPFVAAASNAQRHSGMLQLHHLLGILAAHDVPMDLAPIYENRGARKIPEETIWSGGKLPAGKDRSLTLSLALPPMKLDEAALTAWRATTQRATAGAPTRQATRPDSTAEGIALLPRDLVSAATPATPGAAPGPAPITTAPAHQALHRAARTQPAASSLVMSSYLETMDQFLATQADVMRAVLAAGGPPAAPAREPRDRGPESLQAWPLEPRFQRREPDGTFVFRRRLSIDSETFLLDHTLGGRVSSDPGLKALPILPLTMSCELMAEAAAMAAPGLRPIGLRSVKAHRWICFQRPDVELEIHTVLHPGGREAVVRISEVAPAGGVGQPSVEGVVILAESHPQPPPAVVPTMREWSACRWAPHELYAHGKLHGMFHGPSLRGVASVDRVGPDGAEATLRALPSGSLFASPRGQFLLDPLLLDAASQIVGYWTADRLERAFVVFPTGFERIEVFGHSLKPPAGASCRLQCVPVGADRLRADIDVVVAGSVHARMIGWEVKRIDLPERLYAFRLDPHQYVMSLPLSGSLFGEAGEGPLEACRAELPEEFLETDGAIWRAGLAHLVLSHGERRAWALLDLPERGRTEWLMGRLAAKDAVRILMRRRHGLSLYAADVEIEEKADGSLLASGGWLSGLGAPPRIWLAQSGGLAVAVARAGGQAALMGLDVGPRREAGPRGRREPTHAG